MPERVQLSRQRGWRKPENTIVVSRPTRWGNPWLILTPGGRPIAVARFREMFTTDTEAREAFGYPDREQIRTELDHPCHADVLLELANS